MDDEDLVELRESRQLVDENDEMDFGGTEAELRRKAGVSEEDE
jgi:G patch domain-containing protein 1